jgi:glycosyltransferase involved in cell wall biosynthesis
VAESPLITVALPTYNGARHLAEALRGVLAQEGVAFDLLVCDDRSGDETLAIVRAEAGDRARVEVNPERLGLAGNWNRCVALGRTPWVAIFHQDDVMLPGHLATVVRTINRCAGLRWERRGELTPVKIGLVAGPVKVIDEEGRPVPPSIVAPGGDVIRGVMPHSLTVFPFAPGEFVPFLAYDNPLRCSAVVVRAEAHAEVGGFDPSYRYLVDWEFWLRVARRWGVAWLLGSPTVLVRWHPASETHRFKTGMADLDEMTRLLDHLHAAGGVNLFDAPKLRRKAERNIARAFLNRAHDAHRAGDLALARRCVRRAYDLAPRSLLALARDPRLALALLRGRPSPSIDSSGGPS